MRRLKRYQLHVQARREGAKESRYVHQMWDRYQKIRYGAVLRAVFVSRGARPKRRWGNG